MRIRAVVLTLLVLLLFACGESVDTDALIAESIDILLEVETLEGEGDKAFEEYETILSRVEHGPLMIYNIHMDLADQQEANGWTIDAKQTREKAQTEFKASSLVEDEEEAWTRYQELDALRMEKNMAFIALIERIEDAGAKREWDIAYSNAFFSE